MGRGAQEMAENRAMRSADRRMKYKDWVATRGREAGSPRGRNYMNPQMTAGSPSLLGQVMGPLAGAFGKGVGQQAASGFGSLFGG